MQEISEKIEPTSGMTPGSVVAGQGHGAAFVPPPGFEVSDSGGTFNDHIGPIWCRRSETASTLLFKIEKHHTNPNGTIHGGVLLSLFDIVLGHAIEGLRDGPEFHHAITMHLDCNFISGATLGEIVRAESRADKVGRSVAFSRAEIRVDDRLIATASALYKPPRLKDV